MNEEQLSVRIRKLWHLVANQQQRLIVCDRVYEADDELIFRKLEAGDVVCPACWEAERDLVN